MSKHEKIQIGKKIRPYLNEIAERLWSMPSRAAIMVGAGFSKNASKKFPNWHKLGDNFFEKSSAGKIDKDRKENRYLNVLKLAGEVEAGFGRLVLEQLLRSSIPDSNFSPLHTKLLELPWSDVFTTNFDTLLEQACASVSSQKFDIVINKKDLVYSEKPRIVKLHGSLPSGPFVITEEDYRTYPRKYAPFVNTVQQSLLENTLCLVGFSGDDPNFLQWTGWIKDNLGKTDALKIYLVGIFDLSGPQEKLLENRNITLVDLSKCPGVEENHCKALELFFSYLASYGKKSSALDWPRKQGKGSPEHNKDKVIQLKEVIAQWKETRFSYPGWVIAPKEKRENIWASTNNWFDYVSKNDKLPEALDLEFAFEVNWRSERCLCPIWNNNAELFEDVIAKYWPFQKNPPGEASIVCSDEKHKNLDWKEIQNMWLHLSLAMLRFYREEGMFLKWKLSSQKFNDLNKYLSKEQKAFLRYERVLYVLFELDIPKAKSELASWPQDFSIPFWEAKRAGLLAELGQTKEAEAIIERSLQEVRKKLNLKPVSTDYSLVSEEASIMVLLRYIKDAYDSPLNLSEPTEAEIEEIKKRFINSKYEDAKDSERGNIVIKTKNDPNSEWENLYSNHDSTAKSDWNAEVYKYRLSKSNQLSKSFQERWNILKQYKCDPWDEVKLFRYQLEKQPIEKAPVTKEYQFDIGYVRRIERWGYSDIALLNAYAFLRYFEESGFPFKISNSRFETESVKKVIRKLSKYSPYWAMATLVRTGDADAVAEMFNRQSLFQYKAAKVDSLVDKYLEALEKAVPEIARGDERHTSNFGILIAKTIPEILSRLCSKCSFDKKQNLLDFISYVYASEHKHTYEIKNLLTRLLRTLRKEELYKLIPKLLEIPFPEGTNEITKNNFINPFLLLEYLQKEDVHHLDKLSIGKEHVESLFVLASSEAKTQREWGISSLSQLHLLGLLRQQDEIKLGEILWSKRDITNFPANTQYYKFIFLKLPHPNNVDPLSLLKDYLKNQSFPVQSLNVSIPAAMSRGSVPITNGDIPICSEIIGANRFFISSGDTWSEEEISDLFGRLLQWWDADKEHLRREDHPPSHFSIRDEFKARFRRLLDVFVYVVLPNIEQDNKDKYKAEISRLISELHEYGIPSIHVQAASLPILQIDEKALLSEIESLISGSSDTEIAEGLNAFPLLLKNHASLKSVPLQKFLSILAQIIYWKYPRALIHALHNAVIAVKDFPQQLNEEFEGSCIFGLNVLINESALDKESSEEEFSKKIEVRQIAARLAYQLYTLYKQKNKVIPEEILKWKKICSSEKEFAEIRIEWLVN